MQKKKFLEVLIGSNNQGKIKEIKELLPKNIKILQPGDYKIKSPKENGKSFKANSLIKAKYFSKKTGKICIADDSGLEIIKLKNAPGIYSSRWAGKSNNFNLAIKKIFKKLDKVDKKWKKKKIKARFICALTIYWPGGKTISSIGKIEGRISNKKKGKNGFGYDPIFIPKNKKITFGEMKPLEKYNIDHRKKAYKRIKKFF